MPINFAERLKQLRAELGLSQSQLAEQLGVTKSRINMYERGDREPSFEMQELIADYFNVDMDFLLGKSEYRNKMQWLAQAESDQPLLGKISQLNQAGREKLSDYADDLLEIPAYRADSSPPLTMVARGGKTVKPGKQASSVADALSGIKPTENL